MTRFAAVLLVVAAGSARADNLEPIPDVTVHADTTARRIALDVDLVPLVTDLGKLTVDVLIVPIDHHALRVAPFFAWGSTAPIWEISAAGNPIMQLPEETFRAYGLELGYRYYRGVRGPRGWYIGPSLILAELTEKGSGTSSDYNEIGLAIDTGYSAVIANRVAVALGVGVEGLTASKSFAVQQFPSEMFAQRGIWPRVSLAIGWAFK